MDKIKIIKENKELYEFLGLEKEQYLEKLPESIVSQINKAKLKERDIPTYLWNKSKYSESDCLE